MIAIIIASAVLGLGTALFYWIKVSSIPLTHGIENKEEAEKLALAEPGVQKALEGQTVRKVIVVPGRIVNVVAG